MTHTYCMTSNCALAETCARYEDDAGNQMGSDTITPRLLANRIKGGRLEFFGRYR